MAKCFVVGGGFAGLSSAVFLADKGHHVRLIESSPKLGGRAYSFTHNKTTVDNGQHILMGCYRNTLKFLSLIGSLDKIEIQPALKIDFVARGGKGYELDTEGVTYPFNIVSALRNYEALTKSEKMSLVKLFLKIAISNPKSYATQTTKEFLESNNQSKNSIDALWEVIHVGTMNCRLEDSSAEIFVRILKEIFFTVNDSTKIVLPKVGLTEMYCENSTNFLVSRDCSISCSEKLLSLTSDNGSEIITSITTSKQEYTDFDFLILAIPPSQCSKILSESGSKISLPKYKYSPILNVHLWVENNPLTEKFYGLINSKIHWVFNHKDHLTLTTSAADELINLSDEELLDIVSKELIDFFPTLKNLNILDHLIVKEKRATFIPTKENTIARSELTNKVGNIYLAGDWTNTNFPATIEGAVKSARIVADNLSECQK